MSQPIANGHRIQSEFTAPLGLCHCSAPKLKTHVVATVVRLLYFCRPAAIRFTIPLVVIFSVEGVTARWATPHVAEKLGEVRPLLADCYPTASPIREAGVIRIEAPIPHIRPTDIFTCVTKPVRDVQHFFSPKTTATDRGAVNKFGSFHLGVLVAGAFAQPPTSAEIFHGRESPENDTTNIFPKRTRFHEQMNDGLWHFVEC